ncbi:MAG: tetratricopeptide repeat protein [Gammaproteobacteria bacterium]
MNDKTSVADKDLGASIAMREAGKSKKTSEHAAEYLDEQLKLQREHAQREAALHDLHAENLKLQNHALRAQHQQLRGQRLHARLRTVYQGVLSLVALAILGVIIYAVVSAATDQSVVVNPFHVPPTLATAGDNGTVVAGEFLDQLQILQASSRSSQAAKVLQDAWSNNIQLQVPDVHVSLGDIRRTLHAWLGHQIQISGEVVEETSPATQGNAGAGITLTVRGTGFAARSFSGAPADLPKLLTAAAEYVYGQAEPYLFSAYLEEHGRNAEAIALIKAAYPTAPEKDRPWLLNAWGNALSALNQYAASLDKYQQAVHLNPRFWLVYGNIADSQISLGEEEAAYRTGVRMEKLARRGSWFAARVPGLYYQVTDFLRMDLPASHREIVADEAAHGGQGSLVGQDQPFDAEMLARMHTDKQAVLILQTSPGASSDPYVIAESAFVQGIMDLDRRDYAQAAAQFQTTNTLLTQNPSLMLDFVTQPVCYLGLALGYTGHPKQADADIAQGGHFVDCYRFKADIAEHRGDWAQAQKDYQAAVALAPSLPQADESWGLALLRHQDYKGAIAKFQQANRRGPHWCDPLEYWGEALAAEGNYKDAVEKYTEAAKYTPGWGALQLHWGEALDKLGKHSDALAHYQSAQGSESLTAAEQTTLARMLGHTSLPAS